MVEASLAQSGALGGQCVDPVPGTGAADGETLIQEIGSLDQETSVTTIADLATAPRSFLRLYVVVGDLVALTAGWLPAVWGQEGRMPDGPHRIAGAFLAIIVTMIVMSRAGLYRSRVCALRSSEMLRVSTSVLAGGGVYLAVASEAGNGAGPLPVVPCLLAATAVLLLRWRFCHWLRVQRAAGRFLRKIVLLGTNADAVDLWELLQSEPGLGYRVAGIVGEARPDAPWVGLPTCDDVSGLLEVARRSGANGVILLASAMGDGAGRVAVQAALAAGLHVQVSPGLAGLGSRRVHIASVSAVPLLYVEPYRAVRSHAAIKRAIDVVTAMIAVVITAPLMGLAVVLVKLSGRGPVLYRDRRVGQHGRTITMLKFRTMVPDASKMLPGVAAMNQRTGGPLFKAADDPRITRFGGFLRSTSLDELPQLINVLGGSMSLVGPRPALLSEVEQFDGELRQRHQMRPGITGLWQTEARDNPSFSAYRRLDLAYIDNWSLGLDLTILATTLHLVTSKGVRCCLLAVTGRSGA